MRGLFFGSSVKYVDAFRIALTQILILKTFIFSLRKYADKAMKNHYIFPNKTSINKDKNTHKR